MASTQTDRDLGTKDLPQQQSKAKPVSCAHCRKWHSKCDRKKPSCSGCTERKVACVYEDEPKKRKSRAGKVVVVDDVKKVEKEIERYKRLASYWQDKVRSIEQQKKDSESDRIIEPKGILKLNNSLIFNTLLDVYMWGCYPLYEIKPPFSSVDEFDQYKGYSPEKGLMYGILASASAYTGNIKLYMQLESDAKLAVGPSFDSNHPAITATHFMIAEAKMSAGDCQTGFFYSEIARRSTKNYCERYQGHRAAIHLQNVSNFMYATVLGWAGLLEQALSVVNSFYYSLSIGLSGAEPNYVHQVNIIQMKVLFDTCICIHNGVPANTKQYNSWLALMEQSDALLKQPDQFPKAMFHILRMYQEVVRALIYYLGDQLELVLACTRSVLEIAANPTCMSLHWSIMMVAVVAGFCLVYDWQEELNQALSMIAISSSRHPINAMTNSGVKTAIEQFGNRISFKDFVIFVKNYVEQKQAAHYPSRPAIDLDYDVPSMSNSPEIMDSRSLVETIDNGDQNPVQMTTELVYQDDDVNEFIEQIIGTPNSSNGFDVSLTDQMTEVISPFVWGSDVQY